MTDRQAPCQFRESTVEMIARQSTLEKFHEWCHSDTRPLEMINEAGELVSGPTVFRLFRQFCLGESDE